MASILDRINSPADLKGLSDEELKVLAKEIRRFLVSHVSKTGGHLSSNLGVVELTLALQQVFDTPRDKIIFDVGHQSYVNKILTGRKDRFDTLRKKDGLSGFPKMEESEYDAFDTGHATTSISAAYGYAKARDLRHEDYNVVCVIGDGSITGGMAYEAMNNAGKDKTPLIVVLNDNEMSINHNVGSMAHHLSRLRTRKSYLAGKETLKKAAARYPVIRPLYKVLDIAKKRLKYLLVPGIIFEELGFTYLGPVDGHDIKALKEVLEQAKKLKEPVLIHVITRKGKGYRPAQEHPTRFHGVGPFDPNTVELISPSGAGLSFWASHLAETLKEMAVKDPTIVAITAAMKKGTYLDRIAPDCRVFDVGIAEEHAVTFAAGMAAGGMKPFVVIYSSFLQRAYDQILHDVCLPKLPVVFAVDHAGVVGEDGETHQGMFDLAFLGHMPNMTIMAPSCLEEMDSMMQYALELKSPCAIRYPKGEGISLPKMSSYPLEKGRSVMIRQGGKTGGPAVCLLAVGAMVQPALDAADELEREGRSLSVVNVRFVSPMDRDMLTRVFTEYDLVVTIEDGVKTGGYGMRAAAFAMENGLPADIAVMALPDAFIPQDTRCHTLQEFGLDARGIVKKVKAYTDRRIQEGGGAHEK